MKSYIFIVATSLLTFLSPGLWGVLGSAGFYISEVSYDPKSFDKTTFLMYCFLGFVVGMMIYNLASDELGYVGKILQSPGFLIASGFSVRRMTEVANKLLNLGLRLPDVKRKN